MEERLAIRFGLGIRFYRNLGPGEKEKRVKGRGVYGTKTGTRDRLFSWVSLCH